MVSGTGSFVIAPFPEWFLGGGVLGMPALKILRSAADLLDKKSKGKATVGEGGSSRDSGWPQYLLCLSPRVDFFICKNTCVQKPEDFWLLPPFLETTSQTQVPMLRRWAILPTEPSLRPTKLHSSSCLGPAETQDTKWPALTPKAVLCYQQLVVLLAFAPLLTRAAVSTPSHCMGICCLIHSLGFKSKGCHVPPWQYHMGEFYCPKSHHSDLKGKTTGCLSLLALSNKAFTTVVHWLKTRLHP